MADSFVFCIANASQGFWGISLGDSSIAVMGTLATRNPVAQA
jgi:hypothetical protein